MKSVTDRFKAQAQRDALRFAEADENGDNALSWSEFLLMQPPPVRDKHGDEEIRGWFEEIDADSDGSVSINEYFTWTLSKALHNGDSGLRAVFMEYDKDGTGCLDAREFQRIADDIGFGAAAHDIFMEVSRTRGLRAHSKRCPRSPMFSLRIQSVANSPRSDAALSRLLCDDPGCKSCFHFCLHRRRVRGRYTDGRGQLGADQLLRAARARPKDE